MSKQLLGVVPFVQTQGAFPNCCWKNPVHLTLQEPSFSRIHQSMREAPSQHVTNQQLETVLENGKKWKDKEITCTLQLVDVDAAGCDPAASELSVRVTVLVMSRNLDIADLSHMVKQALGSNVTKTNYVTVLTSSNFTRSLYKFFGVQKLVTGSRSAFKIQRVVKSSSTVTQMFHFRNERSEWWNVLWFLKISFDSLLPGVKLRQHPGCLCKMNKTSIALHQLTPTFNTFGFFWPKLGAKCPYEVYVWISKAQPLASIVGITSVECLFAATA